MSDEARVVRYHADALDVIPTLADESIDAVVTDPPYELGFMGRAWDASGIAYNVDLWKQCFRVLKPGGHLLAFGGTRTSHRLAVAVEDAGFEIRDSIVWIYGSGFPKSLDVSKALDQRRDDRDAVRAVSAYLAAAVAAAGLTEKDLDREFGFAGRMSCQWLTQRDWVLLPKWEQWERLQALLGFDDAMDAEVWRLNGRKGTPGDAWRTATVIRVETRAHAPSGLVGVGQAVGNTAGERQIKAPATDDAKRWAGWGTALKPAHEPIVVGRKPLVGTVAANVLAHGTGAFNIDATRVGESAGRWPANVVLDEDAAAELDEQSGIGKTNKPGSRSHAGDGWGMAAQDVSDMPYYGDTGGASRFFPVFRYQAKAPTRERVKIDGVAHPTVKPLELMRWLVRLVTPLDGVVLEPFAGSGTTVEACILEGMRCLAIEREESYLPLIAQRIERAGLVAW